MQSPVGRLLSALFVTLACLGISSAAAQSPAKVALGVDVLEKSGFQRLAGKRVGLITNPTGVDGGLRSTIDVLAAAKGVNLIALFGPEHGVRGDAAAGEAVKDARDRITDVPVFSLYGKTRKPTAEMLQGIDTLVFDVQDVGCRSYTYVSTMAVAMEAAAEHDIEFVVLDRPNPLGGDRVEGRIPDPAFRSFVSHLPIPYVHGMTVGEIAQMANGEGWLGPKEKPLHCKLTVVPMDGWKRSMFWDQTGLTWVPTSPHIPHADTPFFYASTGILGELGVLTEGVGYPLPFELIGHPELDAEAYAKELNSRKLPGVRFRPAYFKPFYGRLAEKICGGVQVMWTDVSAAELSIISLHALDAARTVGPAIDFTPRKGSLFDKVCGTDAIRKAIEARRPIGEVLAMWREGVAEFRTQRAKYLLYQ
ncbi:MAG: DUF1343 domain-containing protein [Planctomycetes bacterium]|nr:DUF1343 domain-containing protein [Planctomycetota bacterium]